MICYENEEKDIILVNAEDNYFTTTNLGKNAKYRGIVAALPSTGNNVGDMVVLRDTEVAYLYIGSKWISFGQGGGGGDLSNYLAKDNITPYTPSGPYNPATKKYVDDSIQESIVSSYSVSTTDAYSASYINGVLGDVETVLTTLTTGGGVS